MLCYYHLFNWSVFPAQNYHKNWQLILIFDFKLLPLFLHCTPQFLQPSVLLLQLGEPICTKFCNKMGIIGAVQICFTFQ